MMDKYSDAPDEVAAASQVIKQHAAKQKVNIKLDEEVLHEIMKQWESFDPSHPAELNFYVGDRPVAGLKVAVCAYRGDTCCA